MSNAYRAGYSAYYFGGSCRTANPYIPGTESYIAWDSGWMACQFEQMQDE
jgi:hypothetical protein